MPTYLCTDGHAEITITADNMRAAAQEYVDGGDWGEITSTAWVTVRVMDEDGDSERIKITIDPEEPACVGGHDHDWQSPHAIVGGIESNPGVRGHGGGVKITEVCMRCGCGKHTDTWAQDPEDGQQGLHAVSYEPDEFADRIAQDDRHPETEWGPDVGKEIIKD